MVILVIGYFVLSYWAYGYVLLRNKIVFGDMFQLAFRRVIIGAMFGWILIPIALIMKIFGV